MTIYLLPCQWKFLLLMLFEVHLFYKKNNKHKIKEYYVQNYYISMYMFLISRKEFNQSKKKNATSRWNHKMVFDVLVLWIIQIMKRIIYVRSRMLQRLFWFCDWCILIRSTYVYELFIFFFEDMKKKWRI